MSPEVAEAQAAVLEVVREALNREADWSALAAAGLLSLPVPEKHGGEGLGLGEVAVLLREVGSRAGELPVWETLCCGTLTLASAGSDDQRQRLLPGVATGDVILTPAVREAGAGIPETPATRLEAGRLIGRKTGVTYADKAAALLVPAHDGERVVVALVDPSADGVTLLPSPTSRGRTQHTVVLDGVAADVLPGAGAGTLLRNLAVTGLCLTAAGVLAGARDLTADYVKGREQFGRKLAEFQAVAQQVADVYIASRTVSLAADNAAWRLSNGIDPTDDLAVAAHWVCVEGLPALHICQHLHGGMGVDETYPLHRYFSWITDLTHALGGPALTARAVGIEDPQTKNLELTESQRALKAELRDYFTGLADQDQHREMATDRHGPTYQKTTETVK